MWSKPLYFIFYLNTFTVEIELVVEVLMNYKRIYYNIINFRKHNEPIGYCEKHHIIPRQLGGSDCSSNIVKLTAREHFICHYLLAKMYEKNTLDWYKTNHAFMMMKAASSNQQRYFNSHLYEGLRKNMSSVMSESQTGQHNSQFGTFWICNDTTMENKKLPKNMNIPDGWRKGRVINWGNNIKKENKKGNCKYCNNEFFIKTKELYCSNQCRSQYRNPFIGKEKEFIKYYLEHKHIGKALQLCGFPGNWSIYSRWARKTIDEYLEQTQVNRESP